MSFRGVWFVLLYDLGLADGVDGSGEVEHFVGEAPFVARKKRCFCCAGETATSDLQGFLSII